MCQKLWPLQASKRFQRKMMFETIPHPGSYSAIAYHHVHGRSMSRALWPTPRSPQEKWMHFLAELLTIILANAPGLTRAPKCLECCGGHTVQIRVRQGRWRCVWIGALAE